MVLQYGTEVPPPPKKKNNSNVTSDEIHTGGGETMEETINESIMLHSCISLGNSGMETTVNKLNDSRENREAKVMEMGVNE